MRSFLYWLAKLLGDVNAVKRGQARSGRSTHRSADRGEGSGTIVPGVLRVNLAKQRKTIVVGRCTKCHRVAASYRRSSGHVLFYGCCPGADVRIEVRWGVRSNDTNGSV